MRKDSIAFIYNQSVTSIHCFQLHYCDRRQPPGDEIYRKNRLSIFEVDGKLNKVITF